jgi:hypothetical protein
MASSPPRNDEVKEKLDGGGGEVDGGGAVFGETNTRGSGARLGFRGGVAGGRGTP